MKNLILLSNMTSFYNLTYLLAFKDEGPKGAKRHYYTLICLLYTPLECSFMAPFNTVVPGKGTRHARRCKSLPRDRNAP